MDPTLLLTLGIILVATLVGAALRGLHRDRCLRDFDGHPVTVLGKDGRLMWGAMRLQSTGFELEYAADVLDTQLHVETSYLIYRSEYGEVDGMCRFIGDLGPRDRQRRDEALERAFHPGAVQCLVRQMRNFVNTGVDSLNEALAILLGRTRPLAQQQLLTPGQTHLKGLTKNILGHVGTSYDPLLERLVGVQSVVEVQHDGKVYEFVGILRDYSPDFVELLDVYFPRLIRLEVTDAATDGGATGVACRGGLCAQLEDALLTVENRADRTAVLTVRTEGGHAYVERATVSAGETWRIEMPEESRSVRLEARVVERLDMILPRATALIRHRAERYETADAFMRVFWLDEPKARGLTAQRVGIQDASMDYQTLLLNRPEVFPSDEWLSDALEQRERIEESVGEVDDLLSCRRGRGHLGGEKAP